jgi:hypothetical protein
LLALGLQPFFKLLQLAAVVAERLVDLDERLLQFEAASLKISDLGLAPSDFLTGFLLQLYTIGQIDVGVVPLFAQRRIANTRLCYRRLGRFERPADLGELRLFLPQRLFA